MENILIAVQAQAIGWFATFPKSINSFCVIKDILTTPKFVPTFWANPCRDTVDYIFIPFFSLKNKTA